MNLNKTTETKISVFMPVYNGEKHLKRSIESVIHQNFKEFELVIVDDSSTDNSLSIINKYAFVDKRIKVYIKPNGGNVPKSWNFVMSFLVGEFITYMSQDDTISKDYLESNYRRYLETGAQIIIPDIVYDYGNGKTKKVMGIDGDRTQVISGKDAFILSIFSKIHGFTLCKAEIMKSEVFDENIFNSDEYIARKNLIISTSVAFSSGTFYYNLSNENAISKKFSVHQLERLLADQKLIFLMEKYNIESKYIKIVERGSLHNMLRLYAISIEKKEFSSQIVRRIIKNHFNYLKRREIYNSFTKIKKIGVKLIMINILTFKLISSIIYLRKRFIKNNINIIML